MPDVTRQGYPMGVTSTDFGRTLEAAALIEAASRLESGSEHPARLQGALRHNLRLWTVLKGELMRPDHEMPMDLRVDLMRLSAFIDRQTLEILAGPELGSEMLRALIDINRTVAAGLAVAALGVARTHRATTEDARWPESTSPSNETT